MSNKKEEEVSITLNRGGNIWFYNNNDMDMVKQSNIIFFNVEDHKAWKSHKVGDNPNLIGQIHSMNSGVNFHLCFNPESKVLTKHDLLAIIKGIEEVEDFIKLKEKKNGKK